MFIFVHEQKDTIMSKSKVLVGFVLIVYILFSVFEFTGKYELSFYFESLIIPLITLIYILYVKNKDIYFLLFLVFYAMADLFVLGLGFLPYKEDYVIFEFQYYIANSMYIIAYLLLFIKISKSLSLIYVIKNFKIHLIVLTILNVYLIYVLQVIVKPNTAMYMDYYFELVYNIITLTLLSMALLNYFYRDNKKSLYLFLGVLSLVFSEVIDIAFIYIAQRSILCFLATTLSLGAFYFLYQQSKLLNKSREENGYMVAK
tara:strand:- start:71 stop:844 length:774 start_codon:yes stop_codon:yes gene_type:complete